MIFNLMPKKKERKERRKRREEKRKRKQESNEGRKRISQNIYILTSNPFIIDLYLLSGP